MVGMAKSLISVVCLLIFRCLIYVVDGQENEARHKQLNLPAVAEAALYVFGVCPLEVSDVCMCQMPTDIKGGQSV